MPPFCSSFRPALAVALVCWLALLGVGCTSSRSPDPSGPTRARADVEAQLRTAADRWRGVPHEWGGTSHQGVDCSGLVQSIYEEEFGQSLPRTTEDQSKTGQKIRRSALQPGDLVFFRHERKKYHVGIYVADGDFLHASSSSGVTVSPLTRSYWTERWWQARRVLSVAADSSGASSSSPSRSSESSSVGW